MFETSVCPYDFPLVHSTFPLEKGARGFSSFSPLLQKNVVNRDLYRFQNTGELDERTYGKPPNPHKRLNKNIIISTIFCHSVSLDDAHPQRDDF